MNSQLASALIALGGLLVNILFVVFLVVQLRLLREQIGQAKDALLAEQQRARKQSTLEYMAATLDRRHHLRRAVPSEVDEIEVEEFLERANSDPGARSDLYDYLNYYEVIAAAVNNQIFDLETVNLTSGTIFVRIDKAYRGFIESARGKEKSYTLYRELERLATTLRQLRSARDDSAAESRTPSNAGS